MQWLIVASWAAPSVRAFQTSGSSKLCTYLCGLHMMGLRYSW